MVAAGNAVVLGPERSYIQNISTGEVMELEEREGMYMVKMWVNNSGASF